MYMLAGCMGMAREGGCLWVVQEFAVMLVARGLNCVRVTKVFGCWSHSSGYK